MNPAARDAIEQQASYERIYLVCSALFAWVHFLKWAKHWQRCAERA